MDVTLGPVCEAEDTPSKDKVWVLSPSESEKNPGGEVVSVSLKSSVSSVTLNVKARVNVDTFEPSVRSSSVLEGNTVVPISIGTSAVLL